MKNTLTILFAFTLLCATAQNYKLVYYKGVVEVGGQKLAINSTVKNDATVKIGNYSEAIFTNSKKENIHLNKPGTYSVNNFVNYQVKNDKTSLSGYYLNYIVNQATHHQADPEKKPTENLKNVGGVSRGRKPFLNFPVVETKIVDSVITFEWSGSESSVYRWLLMEQINDTTSVSMAEGEVTGNKVMLNLIKLGARKGYSYHWTMSNLDGLSGGSAFVYLATDKERADLWFYSGELIKGKESVPQELQGAILVGLFEEKGYYLLADEGYRRTIESDPDNEFIKQLYQNFRKNIYGE